MATIYEHNLSKKRYIIEIVYRDSNISNSLAGVRAYPYLHKGDSIQFYPNKNGFNLDKDKLTTQCNEYINEKFTPIFKI